MGFINSIFGGGSKNNPANAAMPYLNQIPQVAQQNLGPWAQQGQQQAQQNQNTYGNMVSDPAAFYEQLRATYSPSKGYQFKEDKYRRAAEGAAAAGGFRGTPADQAAQTELVQGLLSEDEGNYMDRLQSILGMGLQGNEYGAQRGYGASGDLSNTLSTNLSQQGGLAYKGQENKNATRQAFTKMMMQLLGGAGGAFLGGPAGAAIGANAAGGFGSSVPSNDRQLGKSLPGYGGF